MSATATESAPLRRHPQVGDRIVWEGWHGIVAEVLGGNRIVFLSTALAEDPPTAVLDVESDAWAFDDSPI